MGYTHYFRPDNCEVIDPKALEIIEALIKEGTEKGILCLEYDTPELPPLVTPEEIRFNGKGDDGHETFVYTPKSNTHYRGFCKTARKPYDIYVQKVLLTLKHFHPDMELDSDGDMCRRDNCGQVQRGYSCTYNNEWKEAYDWADENLPERDEDFDSELNENDFEELTDQIKRGFTSGRLDNSDDGYSISWSLTMEKWKN